MRCWSIRIRQLSAFADSYQPAVLARNNSHLHNMGSLRLDRFALPRTTSSSSSALEYGNVMAMWVADMDFTAPKHITRALTDRAALGLFGYPHASHSDYDAILAYLRRRHGLDHTTKEHLVLLPALVPALNACAKAFATSQSSVLVMPPVYPPFMSAPALQGSRARCVPLVNNQSGGAWEVDWDGLEVAAASADDAHAPPSVMFLCNPHNPVGKVFSAAELDRLLEYCARNDVVLVSDEIHCDLVLLNNTGHVSVLGRGHDDRVVVLHAPSKTYNLAGIGCAVAVIPNSALRHRFKHATRGIMGDVSLFGLCAMRAAYGQHEESEEWRQGLLERLAKNKHIIAEYCNSGSDSKIGFNAEHHRATYLAWLDCSKVNLHGVPSAQHFFLKRCGVALNDGTTFYPPNTLGAAAGKHMVRLNFACTEERLREAMERMTIKGC